MFVRQTPGRRFIQSAGSWNGFAQASELVLADQHGFREPAASDTDPWMIKNLTGGNRAAGDVVELGAHLLGDFDRDHLWFEGNTPSAQGVPNIAVLIRATTPDDLAEVRFDGVCLAKVNVVHVADRFCYVKSGEHRFTSCAIGHHRILNVPGGTGEQLCVLSLGTGVLSCMGKADGAIASGSAGTVNVVTGVFNSEAATGQAIPDCGNHGPDIADEQLVTAGILHGQFYVSPLGCDE